MNTYGATRDKLIAHGYIPTSATTPGAHGYRVADDPAAIMCIAQHGGSCGVPEAGARNVVALTVCVRNGKIRADIETVLGRHGVGKGPHRIDSAGNVIHVVALSGYGLPQSRASQPADGESSPAVALDSFGRPESHLAPPVSAIIRLDGDWKGGSLLTVARAKLPAFDDDGIAALFADVEKVLAKHAVPTEVPKIDHRKYKPASGTVYQRLEMQTGTLPAATDSSRLASSQSSLNRIFNAGRQG